MRHSITTIALALIALCWAVVASAQSFVTLAWDPQSDATGFNIYVDGIRTPPSVPASTAPTVVMAVSTAQHTFDVTAYNDVGESAHSAQVVWSPQVPLTCPDGYFKAEYFGNTTESGSPIMAACEGSINYDWGAGGPYGLVDYFSVRWTGTMPVSPGTLTVTATTDDGMRVQVGSTLLLDSWIDQGATTYMPTMPIASSAVLPMVVDYYESGGFAVAKVSWNFTAPPPPVDTLAPTITEFTVIHRTNNQYRIHVAATDDVGVARIDVRVNGTIRKTCAAVTICDYNPTKVVHVGDVIGAQARDAVGNSTLLTKVAP